MRRDEARSHRAVRLRSRAVACAEPAHDRRRQPARCAGARRAGQGRRRRRWSTTAISRSASIISRWPTTASPRPPPKGRLHRNFQGYTSDAARTLIGIGATSIGRTPQGYVQNTSETGAWSRAVAAGKLPIARGHALTAQDRLRAGVIERIMCDGKVDLAAAGHALGFAEGWYAAELPELLRMQQDGLLTHEGGKLNLAAEGLPLARVVASVFDTYLRDSTARHSVAV